MEVTGRASSKGLSLALYSVHFSTILSVLKRFAELSIILSKE